MCRINMGNYLVIHWKGRIPGCVTENKDVCGIMHWKGQIPRDVFRKNRDMCPIDKSNALEGMGT